MARLNEAGNPEPASNQSTFKSNIPQPNSPYLVLIIAMSIVYHSLDRKRLEIRLLEVLSMPSPKHARIPGCRIIQASLLKKPQYIALSYVWGNPEKNRVIIVDNTPIRIPENLFGALMALRPIKGLVTLWIDYLCINQQDDAEKSWQVALMKDIYSQANQVLAWLGPIDDETTSTLTYLNSFGEKAEACGFHQNPRIADVTWRALASGATLSFKDQLHYLLQSYCQPEITELFFSISGWHTSENLLPLQGIKSLFNRPWWGRVWVLQEIALPKKAEFICGSVRISRNFMCAAVNAYQAFWRVVMGKMLENQIERFSGYHRHIMISLVHFRPQIMANARRLYKQNQFSLIALLRLTCVGSVNLSRHGPHNLDSTDPRDKIFALLSLASDKEELREKGVYPDYQKSCQEVYILTTSALLQQGHISLLSYVQYPKSEINLPSWVPDWSTPITNPLQILRDDHMTVEPEFHAAGVSKYTPHITLNVQSPVNKMLSLDAYVYDRIERLGSFPKRQSCYEVPILDTFSWPREWLTEILYLTYQTKHHYTNFHERLRAVARTSIGGAAYIKSDASLSPVGDARFIQAAFLLHRCVNRLKPAKVKREAQKFLTSQGVMKKLLHMKEESLHLTKEIIGRSLRRLPFITIKGNLGISTVKIREGDYVAIIKGAQVPYILRLQSNKSYRLVGEAFVDGIMEDELAGELIFTPLTLE